jgi:hypothetical protein
MVVKLLIKCLPNSILESVNAESLAELDKRKLIIWAEDTQGLEPEDENSAFNLASRFQEVTPTNMSEILKTIAQIYTEQGDCLALAYLMEIAAEYFNLIKELENV